MDSTRTCSVDGCDRKNLARSLCGMHYQRWRRNASPVDRLAPTRGESFWAHVDRSAGPDGCWVWTGTINDAGYGLFGVGGRNVRAHRYAYMTEHGTEPVGEVDHTCHNSDIDCTGGNTCPHRACVNPRHLEDVSHAVNVARGRSGYMERRKTHCPQGHEYTPENTIYPLRPNGKRNERVCRRCNRVAQMKYNAKRKAA